MKLQTPRRDRRRVLVVDDDVETRSALDAVLKLAGHDAHFVTDGDEAMEVIDGAQIPFDLVITNHQMARLSGLDLMRSLEEKGFVGEIIVLTASPKSSFASLISLILGDAC